MKNIFLIVVFFLGLNSYSQDFGSVSGRVTDGLRGLAGASVLVVGADEITYTDSLGYYILPNLERQHGVIQVSLLGYKTKSQNFSLDNVMELQLQFNLEENGNNLNEVVISGTLKAVKRLESPVPVEVISSSFLKKNPTSNVFDALQNSNGVRPQINCGVCNTGDIKINGLEGPYTLVLIDGMPIVSSLSTVYGLSGIPNSLIQRIEVVKGPASSLYGSEAVGGLINIITKNPISAPVFSADIFTTSYLENNIDLGLKTNVGEKAVSLLGVNLFKYNEVIDSDGDNFTDLSLAQRTSIFNKWSFNRSDNKLFTIALRGLYEDRWGGDIRYQKQHRGGDEIYGESIQTKRAELIGTYQLPFKEKLMISFSGTLHYQDSQYGLTSYLANQKIGFAQLTWDKKFGINNFLMGMTSRYMYYNDNTPATAVAESTWLPGLFVQNEMTLSPKSLVLLGMRYDENSVHGSIFTPRFAYRYKLNDNSIFRLNAGSGFRVVTLFAEDHAALTGARVVEIKNSLKPEQSYNVNLNFTQKINFNNGTFASIEGTAFYTYFSNKVIADYVTDPQKIIYDNINGHAIRQGFSLNLDVDFPNGLELLMGATSLISNNVERGISERPYLTEKFTGTWSASYKIVPWKLSVDYTGNVYSPMKMPLLSDLDPRSPNSPWYSIQNIQFTFMGFKNVDVYAGVKNLLNFRPMKGNPFLIARSHDPFDKDVTFDANGQAMITANNPYGLTFDTSYVYAQNQSIRGFIGLRYSIR